MKSQPIVLGGRYEVEEELGRGGMAKVYRGIDTVLGRPVAVKILAPQFSDDLSFVHRFRREAQAAARLNNANLVSVYDTGDDDGIHYIVMEFVEGKTLADYLAGGGRIMPQRAIEIGQAVSNALTAAHAQGVIHRDIKPGNIMITPDGEVKVTDFGIARVIAGAETVAQTAAVLGTASYLSPEQAQGQPVDQRSDIYSLGCVLYEMVTGRPPFTGESPVAVASKQVLEQPVPPSKLNSDVSPSLDAVIMRALAKNPANRYQSAEELRQDLERARRGEAVEATPLLPDSASTQLIARPERTMVLGEQPPPGPGRGGPRWWVWLVVLLLLGGLGVGLFFWARNLLNANAAQVRVPSVVGFTQAAAEARLKDAGFKPVAQPQVTSNPSEVGNVLRQTPDANALADKGSEVTIFVGKPPKQATVPDVVGKTEEDARKALVDANLTVGTITPQADPAPPGQVIAQSIAPNEQVDKGTPVDLTVSSGPGTVTVPDVTCESFGQAKSDLRAANLSPIQSTEPRPTNPACPNGSKVAAQDPPGGAQVDSGSTVTLYPGGAVSPSPTGPTGLTGE